MTPIRLLALVALCLTASASAFAQTEQVVVPLTDPARPATLSLHVVQGSIVIRGSNRRDIVVTGRGRDGERPRRAPEGSAGLRRLSQAAGFSIEEARNVVDIEAENPNRTIDFEILVPTRTNLRVATTNNGVITIDAVDGELEVSNVNGPITLTQVAGSVVANTVNGRLAATMTRVTGDKPMAFISFNGAVDVTLPSAIKANLKLRSDMGDVFSDFDIQLRPAPTEPDRRAAVRETQNRREGRFQIEVNRLIYGTVNGGGPEIEMRTFNGSVFVRKAP